MIADFDSVTTSGGLYSAGEQSRIRDETEHKTGEVSKQSLIFNLTIKGHMLYKIPIIIMIPGAKS